MNLLDDETSKYNRERIMKKELNPYKLLVSMSPQGFFVIYYIDNEDETYEEVLKIGMEFLVDEQSELFAAMSIFSKIKEHLPAGSYFCVFKNGIGADWWSDNIE